MKLKEDKRKLTAQIKALDQHSEELYSKLDRAERERDNANAFLDDPNFMEKLSNEQMVRIKQTLALLDRKITLHSQKLNKDIVAQIEKPITKEDKQLSENEQKQFMLLLENLAAREQNPLKPEQIEAILAIRKDFYR